MTVGVPPRKTAPRDVSMTCSPAWPLVASPRRDGGVPRCGSATARPVRGGEARRRHDAGFGTGRAARLHHAFETGAVRCVRLGDGRSIGASSGHAPPDHPRRSAALDRRGGLVAPLSRAIAPHRRAAFARQAKRERRSVASSGPAEQQFPPVLRTSEAPSTCRQERTDPTGGRPGWRPPIPRSAGRASPASRSP